MLFIYFLSFFLFLREALHCSADLATIGDVHQVTFSQPVYHYKPAFFLYISKSGWGFEILISDAGLGVIKPASFGASHLSYIFKN